MILPLLACGNARAVVIYGSTDPSANTTAPTGTLLNSGWQWAAQYDATLVTAIAPNWVVVAEHWRVATPLVNTIYVNSVPYTVDNVNYVRVGSTDLTLLKVNGQLPSFAPMSTNAVTSDEGKFMFDVGKGKDSGSPLVISSVTKGWLQGPTNGHQRWGTNNTLNTFAQDSTLGNFLLSTFDASGGFNEMSLDIGDSSGPLFVQEGGTWKLAGVNYGAADVYSTSSDGSSSFSANIYDYSGLYDNSTGVWAPSTHGTYSYYSHIGSSYSLISTATGVINWTGNSASSQNWNTGTKWAGGTAPNGVDKVAVFTNTNTSGGHINVNVPVTLGTLLLASGTTAGNLALSYTIDGSSTLTFDISAALNNATLRTDYGSHTINAPLATNKDLYFDIGGTQLTLTGSFTNSAGKALTKTGTGTLQMTGSWSNGIGSSFLASGGSTSITQDMGSNTSVTANSGGTISFVNSQHLAGLTVNSGGVVNGPSAANGVLTVTSLAMNGGKLDLGLNDLIVHATAGTKNTVYSNVLAAVTTGFANGAWNGNGIKSTNAASNAQHLTALATLLNDNGSGSPYVTTFDGESVGANDILVKYTWYGDADLNGIVNAADLTLLLNGFSNHLSGWRNGDFNNDGVINAADFALYDNTLNFFGGTTLSISEFNPLGLAALTTVPEPATATAILLGMAGLIFARWQMATRESRG